MPIDNMKVVKTFMKKVRKRNLQKFLKQVGFFHGFCILITIYNIITLILVIIKKDEYKKMKYSPKLTLLFSYGSLINTLTFYAHTAGYYKFPCFLGPYINGIGFPLNLFSSMGLTLMYLKQCYTNIEFYNKENADYTNAIHKKGYLRKISMAFTETKLINVILIYITFSIYYVLMYSLFERNYSMHPLTHGFCQTNIEQIPPYALILFYIFIFSPLALHDIAIFGSNFSFGRVMSNSSILILIFSILYVLTSMLPAYKCNSITRIFPPNFYAIMLFFVYNISFVTVPLVNAFSVTSHIKGLELTKKGMVKIFDDELLYKEFFEYAIKKRSVEYVLFHLDYMAFKNIFKSNQAFIEDITENGATAPGPDPTNAKDKKLLQVFGEIYEKAYNIYTKYFTGTSDLELNVPAKISKDISTHLYQYNINYNRYLVNAEIGNPVDIKLINCETLFDVVHEEALDSLFLNVYSSFTKDKKKLVVNNENGSSRKKSVQKN